VKVGFSRIFLRPQARQSPVGPNNVRLGVSVPVFHRFDLLLSLALNCLSKLSINHVKMLVKRTVSQHASRDDTSSSDSSNCGDNYVIAPCPRRETRKTTRQAAESSFWAAVEAADLAKGRAIPEAWEEREIGIIQKVECPLQPNFEYTLRRVDRRHPHRLTDFARGENQFIEMRILMIGHKNISLDDRGNAVYDYLWAVC
jgi:hypothetical protein